MAREHVWYNPDGLAVGFGTRTEEKNSGTKVSLGGQRQQVIVDIKGTELLDVSVAAQLIYGVTIPAGALLESAKIVVDSAFLSGGVAVLDVGLYNAATGAEIDDDGIDAAVAIAALETNDVVACDGALIGTILANNSKIGVTFDAFAYTAGVARLVVEYIPKIV